MIQFETGSPEETLALGRRIGALLRPGAVVGLDGDLGTGKTWLSKGLVRGIGECDETLVKSPAFNLIHEYRPVTPTGEVSVFHIDFYRLDELSETDELLFGEYFEQPGIFLVEWAEKFLDQLAASYLSVKLRVSAAAPESGRHLEVGVVGGDGRYHRILRRLGFDEDSSG